MWDERYSTEAYVYGTEPNQFLREAQGEIRPGRVLCLAAGEGRNAVYLAEQGYEVLAVDSSRVGLGKAERLARERGVQIETVHADLRDYRIESDYWSGIVAIFAHLPPDLRRQVHAQAVAGLQERGLFVLEAYAPEQLSYGTGGPPNAELLMSVSDLEDELQGLRFEVLREVVREVREGEYHTGLAAVVQILGRKPAARGPAHGGGAA